VDYPTGYRDGYRAGYAAGRSDMDMLGAAAPVARQIEDANIMMPKKRKPSAYSRKYKAAFRRIAPTYKNKNGTWRKGGFKAAVKAAHKAVKK